MATSADASRKRPAEDAAGGFQLVLTSSTANPLTLNSIRGAARGPNEFRCAAVLAAHNFQAPLAQGVSPALLREVARLLLLKASRDDFDDSELTCAPSPVDSAWAKVRRLAGWVEALLSPTAEALTNASRSRAC